MQKHTLNKSIKGPWESRTQPRWTGRSDTGVPPPWVLTGLGAPGAQAVRARCCWEGAGLASEGIWSLLRAVETACRQDFQTLSWLGRKPGWTDARQGLLQAPGHKPLALD